MAEAAFLLDSNILIYLLRGLSPGARARVEQCEPGEIVTSAIVYAEVMRKAPPDEVGQDDIDALFEIVPIRPFDTRAALEYRNVPFRRGKFDRLIAAHALALGLTLVTNNEDDFDGVQGLKIENWTSP